MEVITDQNIVFCRHSKVEARLPELLQQVHHCRDVVADLRGNDLLEGRRNLLRQTQPSLAGHRSQKIRGRKHQHQSKK